MNVDNKIVALEEINPSLKFTGNDPFRALVNALSEACEDKNGDKRWINDSVFMMKYEGDDMEPTISSGSIIYVDTEQVPKLDSGPVTGHIYLIKVLSKFTPYILVYVQPCINGRFYWNEFSNKMGDEKEYVSLLNIESYLEDNSRFIGRVIGVVNPL